jgi:hypothetical protein
MALDLCVVLKNRNVGTKILCRLAKSRISDVKEAIVLLDTVHVQATVLTSISAVTTQPKNVLRYVERQVTNAHRKLKNCLVKKASNTNLKAQNIPSPNS